MKPSSRTKNEISFFISIWDSLRHDRCPHSDIQEMRHPRLRQELVCRFLSFLLCCCRSSWFESLMSFDILRMSCPLIFVRMSLLSCSEIEFYSRSDLLLLLPSIPITSLIFLSIRLLDSRLYSCSFRFDCWLTWFLFLCLVGILVFFFHGILHAYSSLFCVMSVLLLRDLKRILSSWFLFCWSFEYSDSLFYCLQSEDASFFFRRSSCISNSIIFSSSLWQWFCQALFRDHLIQSWRDASFLSMSLPCHTL